MNELNILLNNWKANIITDGQAINDILDLPVLPNDLYMRILNSVNESEPEYLTDCECLELIDEWHSSQRN